MTQAITLTERHQAALRFARAGWEILPLEGKRPARILPWRPKGKGGARLATRDEAQINAWWSQGDWNIGGRVRPGEVVLDIDVRHGGEASLARLEEAFAPLPVSLIHETGSRDGSQHLIFQGDASRLSVPREIFPGIDLRGRGNYIVLPGSIHETGGLYRVDSERPILPLPHWVYEALSPRVELTTVAVRTRRPLSPAGATMIRTGIKTTGDRSASGVFWSCLWFAAAAGITAAEIAALASDPANQGLYPYAAKRGPQHVQSQYAYVLKLGRKTDLFARLGAIETAAERGSFPGLRGSHARLLLGVMIETAYKASSTTFRLSTEQAMAALNIPRAATIRSARTLLEQDGWITEVAAQDARGGKSFCLQIPVVLQGVSQGALTPTPEEHDPKGTAVRIGAGHNIFTPAGLGKSAAVVLGALVGDMTAAELVAASGKATATVYRALKGGMAVRLVEQDGRTYRLHGEAAESAAEALGVIGVHEVTAEAIGKRRTAQAAWKATQAAAREDEYQDRLTGATEADRLAIAAWRERGFEVIWGGDLVNLATGELTEANLYDPSSLLALRATVGLK